MCAKMDRQRSFAWAKYYESMGQNANRARVIVWMIGRHDDGKLEPKENLPKHITQEFYDMAEQLNKQFTCPVCYELVTSATIQITHCGHVFCKECLEQWKKKPNAVCPICRKKL